MRNLTWRRCSMKNCYLALILEILGLLLPHDLQLLGQLYLSLPLCLLGLLSPALPLLLPQRVQRSPRILHLAQLVLRKNKKFFIGVSIEHKPC